jgi:hypothetical protein
MKQIVVKWINSVNETSDQFFDRCFPSPKEGRWWYETLENSGLEDQFKFFYALILRGDEPIGIAPTFVMDVPMELVAPPEIIRLLKMVPLVGKVCPFLVYQKTIFIGSPCADEGTVGLIPGVELREVAPALQDAVCERATELGLSMIVWKDFCQSDADQLETLCQTHGVFKVTSYPGTMLSIPANGLAGYYDNLKSSRRHNLRKKLRRSAEHAKIEVEIVRRPSLDVLEEIFALFWQTYERGKTKLEQLNLQFFKLIAEADVSRFVLLRNQETKQLMAFMLCFQLGDKVINKFIGLDYGCPQETYLYFRLWEAALEWVISTGASEFQSGQTGYRAKIDVGNSLVPLTNYGKHRNSIIHKIYAEVSKTITWKTIDSDLEVYLSSKSVAKRNQDKPELSCPLDSARSQTSSLNPSSTFSN